MNADNRPKAARGSDVCEVKARQKKLGVAGAGLLLLLLAGALAFVPVSGTDLASATIARMKSVLELFNQRSPGRRTEAHLNKIKHKMAARPHERALPKIRIGLPLPPIENSPALVDLLAAPPASIPFASSEIPIGPILQSVPPGRSPPGPPSFIIPLGQPNPSPPIVPAGTPAVPEPSTWILMMCGFSLIGWQVRCSSHHKLPHTS